MLKVIWIGFLGAVGAGIAYWVWMSSGLGSKSAKNTLSTSAKAAKELQGRKPGGEAGALTSGWGEFGKSKMRDRSHTGTPTEPVAVGPFGIVGAAPIKSHGAKEYHQVKSDSRVPSFLQGATGGTQDAPTTGTTPPPVLGCVPMVGSGGYSACTNNTIPDYGQRKSMRVSNKST